MSVLWSSTLVKLTLLVAKVFDNVIWVFGPAFILTAVVLIGGCVFLYYHTILPFVLTPYSLLYNINLLISFWLLANITFNYFACVTSSPGSPPRMTEEQSNEALRSKARVCKKCVAVKPERTHHCNVCNRCVYRMDHHCVWMHNCVGHFNHRYFFLFIFYLWLGCAYFCAITSVPFIQSSSISHRKWTILHPEVSKTAISFAFILAAAICCSLTLMMVWNLYLILSAQTTIEFYTNRYHAKEMKLKGEIFFNVYDMGTLNNFKFFFNLVEYPWWTLLLPMKINPPSDGRTFPSLRPRDFDV